MGELGHVPAKGLVEHYMLWCRWYPFFGANDMANPHQMVVNHIGQMIGGETVCFQQDLVIDFNIIISHILLPYFIEECGCFIVGFFNFETYHVWLSGMCALTGLSWVN